MSEEAKEAQNDEREALVSIYEGDNAFKQVNSTTFQYKVCIYLFPCRLWVNDIHNLKSGKTKPISFRVIHFHKISWFSVWRRGWQSHVSCGAELGWELSERCTRHQFKCFLQSTFVSKCKRIFVTNAPSNPTYSEFNQWRTKSSKFWMQKPNNGWVAAWPIHCSNALKSV